jgi:hypothetical protein
MFVCVFLCCVVLCRQRPCAGLIPPPRGPTKCLRDPRNWNRSLGWRGTVEALCSVRSGRGINNNNNNNNNNVFAYTSVETLQCTQQHATDSRAFKMQ